MLLLTVVPTLQARSWSFREVWPEFALQRKMVMPTPKLFVPPKNCLLVSRIYETNSLVVFLFSYIQLENFNLARL